MLKWTKNDKMPEIQELFKIYWILEDMKLHNQEQPKNIYNPPLFLFFQCKKVLDN